MPMPQIMPTWLQMQQQASSLGRGPLAQNEPTDEEIAASQQPVLMDIPEEEQAALAAQGIPITPVKPPHKAMRSPPTQASQAEPAVSYDKMMREMADQYGAKSKEATLQQQQGADQLAQHIEELRGMKSGPDLRGLAALIDSTTGSNYAPTAQAMHPPTAQEKAEKLISLQNMLQERKNEISKNNLAALKEQIDAYKASKVDPLDTQLKLSKIGFYGQGRQALQDQRLAEQAHRTNLSNLEHSKPLQTKLAQIQGLDNAGAMIEKAPEVTPQLFHDYQQAVIAAVNRGNSGIGERAERYLTSAGIDSAKVRQYLAGKPVDIGKNDPMLKAIQGFAQTERGNIEKQYGQIADTATSGQERWYNKNPQMKKDLMTKIKSMKGMVSAPVDMPADADLSKMSNEELQQYIDSHGG